VKIRKLIVSLYLLLFAGLGVTGGILFWDASAEYSRLEAVQAENRRRLAEAQAQLASQEKVLERLRNDPAFVEKVIRRKLGYAKPDEFIFHFAE
jgi:cell division protein DivIC